MNATPPAPGFALLVIKTGGSTSAPYSLEEAAHVAGLHPERLRYYCRIGLFGADLTDATDDPVFDDDRLYELRRFEHFRQQHGVNQKTLRLLGALWREVERLRTELNFLRER